MSWMRRWCAALALASTAVWAGPPEVDALATSTRRLDVPTRLSDGTQALVDRARISSVDERLGVPTFVWAERDPRAADLRAAGVTAEQAARRVLFSWAELYRVPGAQLAEAALVRLHDLGDGPVIATFERRVGGVPLFRDRLHVILDQRLRLVALSGALNPAAPGQGEWRLTAETAVSAALRELVPGAPALRANVHDASGALLVEAVGGAESARLLRPARARKVYFGLDRALVPAWSIEFEVGAPGATDSELFSCVIAAHDGAVLFRHALTEADAFTYRVWADPASTFPHDGPQGLGGAPHPTATPDGFVPPYVAPDLVTLESAPFSRMDPWLPAGATETTGNNVEAYADLASPDGFGTGDLRATTTAAGVFDRVFDPTAEPNASAAQQQAAITQLFYTVNFLHDWFYDSGFDEAAGNAQENNFGRGGVGNDSIKAEGQDSSGTNNANMSTPSDGARPRMQMYLWRPPTTANIIATPPGSTWTAGTAAFGPQGFSLTGAAVQAVPPDGCAALTNAAAVAGKIAVIDRGTCSFAIKAATAQAAGAIGTIIVNNVSGAAPTLGGTDPSIVTPVLSLSQADGAALKAAIAGGPVQVTLARTAAPMRDGTVDSTIIAHEWGHYLTNRLISDAAGLTNQQGRGMGEGWGDFTALLLQVRGDDAQVAANANFGGTYATAAYSMSGPGNPQAFYFGIRRYPYSVDFTKNALTFRHIADGQALPTGIPTVSNTGANSEVHNAGEVWASALWEGYVGLLRAAPRLSFDEARERMKRYLVEGLKATPPAPTFLEARDAILAAAAARDQADFQVLAQAFARRGMGLLAVAPPRTASTNTPLVEDFTLGNDLSFLRAELDDERFYCDRDGLLDSGERGRLRLTLKNTGFGPLSATTGTVSSSTPDLTITNGALTFPASLPLGVTTAEAEVALSGASAIATLTFELTFGDPQLTNPAPRTVTIQLRGNADEVASSSPADDVETSLVAWTPGHAGTLPSTFDWRRSAVTPMAHVYFGVDPSRTADTYLVSPPLQVGSGPLSFTFNHRYAFESSGTTYYDGAVLELSADNGQTWTDIGASASPGYNGRITTAGPSTNPLANRQGFVDRSPGYPAMISTTVSLGTAYAGQTVQVRFRIGADSNAADVGWEIDDVAFTGLANTPFPSLAADRGQCINRPPVADAGPDFAVDERSPVTLDASRSSDVDSDALTATWTQVSGPPVTLAGGSFVAPEVTVDTPATFRLVVNDGAVDSPPDEVTVTIRQVNRAPTADAGAPLVVDELTPVALTGSGSDPDGDAVTFLWRQVSGPPVVLSATAAPSTSFFAPEVRSDSDVVLELTTSDGQITSARSRVAVTVRQVNQPPSVRVVGPASVAEGAEVTLSAIGTDPDGDALSWSWSQVSGPPVTLRGTDAASIAFAAPTVSADDALVFQVTASDGRLSSAPAAFTVRVVNDNRPPIANPGAAQEVSSGAVVTLDGSGSSDPEGTPLRFSWSQADGPRVSLDGAATARPSFTAPAVSSDTVLIFRLAVVDAQGLGATATAKVTVQAAQAQGCGCTGAGGGALAWAALLGLLGRVRRRSS